MTIIISPFVLLFLLIISIGGFYIPFICVGIPAISVLIDAKAAPKRLDFYKNNTLLKSIDCSDVNSKLDIFFIMKEFENPTRLSYVIKVYTSVNTSFEFFPYNRSYVQNLCIDNWKIYNGELISPEKYEEYHHNLIFITIIGGLGGSNIIVGPIVLMYLLYLLFKKFKLIKKKNMNPKTTNIKSNSKLETQSINSVESPPPSYKSRIEN